MRIRHLLAAAMALLSLSACVPDGYREAPAVSALMTELIPKDSREQVIKFSVCQEMIEGAWRATVKVKDGGIYQYRLEKPSQEPGKPTQISLDFFNTKAFREARWGNGRRYGGCFDHGGEYQFAIGEKVTAYVDNDWLVSEPFDDAMKLRLKLAAQAVELAVATHKKHIPIEAGYGIKP